MNLDAIQELDSHELRKFGITTGAIVGVLFGILLPWIWEFGYPVWPWVVFAVLCLWALVHPESLGPVYKAWMRFGLLISKVTTPLILGIVFYLVFVPVGMLLRLLSHDPMKRKFDESSDSYRIEKSSPANSTLEKPY